MEKSGLSSITNNQETTSKLPAWIVQTQPADVNSETVKPAEEQQQPSREELLKQIELLKKKSRKTVSYRKTPTRKPKRQIKKIKRRIQKRKRRYR